MKKIFFILLGVNLFLIGLALPAFAGELSNYELTQRLKNLEKQAGISGISSRWMDRLSLSGLLEAEAGYESMDYDDPALEDEDASDLALATMELGVDAAINDYVSAHALFLWEEDDTGPVDLDEGFITLTGGAGFPAYLRAGKMYVPFGNFASNMVSDPLTLELGETRESAVLVGAEEKGYYGSVYLFNGDADKFNEDSHVDNYGAQAGLAMETRAFNLDMGASYINNIADADAWEGVVGDFEVAAGENVALDDPVGGLGVHATMGTGPFVFIAEYITALDEAGFVRDSDGSALATVAEISAWNAEVGCFFELGGKPATAALAYQGSADANDFLPETRLMGAIAVKICEATSLALEYFHDEFENDDEADVITAQLAVEF